MSDETKTTTYWRSMDEFRDDPEFDELVKREFPSQLPKLFDDVSRRRFLQVMGASMAMLGLSGCRWPQEEIVPFTKRPPETKPGVPKRFATSFPFAGVGLPVLATSVDGRPIKVDGNPDHAMSLGGSNVFLQASVLSLYDPDRSRRPMKRDGAALAPADGKGFLEVVERIRKQGGRGFRVLSEATSSPTVAHLREKLVAAFPGARWHEHEPCARPGPSVRPMLENAEVIVCIDDDLLLDPAAGVRATRDFARRRRPENGAMNRLYVVESGFSTTGGMADHRRAVPAARLPAFVADLGKALDGEDVDDDLVRAIARDLNEHRGRGLITAGPTLPTEVQHTVRQMNQALANVGRTVDYRSARAPLGIEPLVAEMKAGKVGTLLILGGNPVYTAPADLDFAAALTEVETSIHLSEFVDETSHACDWHVNRAHYLESWADTRAIDGRPGVVQPLIRPLYAGKTVAEVLALFLGEEALTAHDLVQRTWREKGLLPAGDFEAEWRRVLHDGFVRGAFDAGPPPSPYLDAGAGPGGPARPAAIDPDAFTAVFRPDRSVFDGRFANNAWLQEMPDSLTAMTWDNAALIAPADADALGVDSGDHLRITAGDRSIEIPAYVLPGHAEKTVSLPLGYGRRHGGRVADGVGVDVNAIRTTASPWVVGVEVRVAQGHTMLAVTHNHHAIDPGGEKAARTRMERLIREATIDEYTEHPDAIREKVHVPHAAPIFEDPLPTDGHRWAMSIDLSACTGCNACVVACQSENNVPVVGKDEVSRGREMHWLRLDRYFGGEPEDATVRHQPVPCMQCENAPCEQVCPVGATMHSDEGLNDMVYNRCIGTRYCSNNCPYKVRRFNWFLNNDGLTDIQKMVMNPEVTVRSRGVMEKCTYCVQRINTAKIDAKNRGESLSDGDVTPACAQSCPAEAIVFGDLSDPESRVSRRHRLRRSYGLLEELNTKPRTRYLARLKNPRS